MRFGEAAERMLELLLPPACAGCGGPVRRRGERLPRICVSCLVRLKGPPHPRCSRCAAPRGTGLPAERACPECHDWPDALRLARSAVVLLPPADRLVYALKYGGWPELASAMAERMGRTWHRDPGLHAAEPSGRRPLLVPVPTTPGRLRVRGYNQARVLAEALGDAVGSRLVDALVRPGGGTSQIDLLPGERRANVDEAFSMRDGKTDQVRDREVVLVDDVLTTGATASAAARALERGGARSVRLLTFARSLPDPS